MTFSNPVSGEGRGDAGIESAGRAAASLPVGVVRSLASVAVGLGVLLRLLLLHQRAPLWQDEAMVAVNVLHRSWSDLLRPLDYAQVAPLPYLLCLKVMVALFGHGEAVLRLPAFVAGICMLVVLYEVAKDRLGLQVTLAALVLAGCSAILLRYSAEVKPYSFDALFGAAVPYVVIRIEGRACRNPRRLLGLWVAGMAAGSIVALFLVGGLLIAIAASPVARARIGWPILGAVGFGAATVYAVLYFGVYGPTVTSAPMLQFWGSGFLDLLEPGRFERLRRLLSGFAQLLPSFPPLAGEMRTLLIVAAGVLLLPGSAGLGLALTAPSLLAIIASALGLYPISPRLLLISYTPLLLGLAATFSALSPASKSQRARAHVVLLVLSVAVLPGVSALPPDWSVLGVLVAALLVVSLGTHFPPAVRLILPAALAILVVLPKAAVVIHTPARNDGRITIARVVAAPGSAVYIPAAAAPAWLYYTSRWDRSEEHTSELQSPYVI